MGLQCNVRFGNSMKKTGMILFSLLVLIAATIFFLEQKKKQESEKVELIACADIVHSCGNAKFSVRFKEAPQVMKPLNLVLASISPEQIQNIHANFAMKGMEMGFNRYQLLKAGQNEWQAEVTLPVCVQGRSDWEMLIEMDTAEGKQRFLVPFSAAKK